MGRLGDALDQTLGGTSPQGGGTSTARPYAAPDPSTGASQGGLGAAIDLSFKSHTAPATPAPTATPNPFPNLPQTEIHMPEGKLGNSLQNYLIGHGVPGEKIKNDKFVAAIGDAFDGFVGTLNSAADKIQTFLGTLDSGSNNTPTERLAAGAKTLTIPAELAFSAIGSVFKAGEGIPIIRGPLKLFNEAFSAVSQVPAKLADKGVEALPVSQETKDQIKQPLDEILNLVTPILLGKGIDAASGKVAPLVKEKFNEVKQNVTKDIATQYNIPQNVYIEASKIRDIFQTGKLISPEEEALVRSLGLDGTAYKEAIRNGLTIEVPSEKVVTITDKPYWAKLKTILGREPQTDRIVTTDGKTVAKPKEQLALPAPKPEDVAAIKDISPTDLVESPINSAVLDRVKFFLPEQASAFGRKILKGVEEQTGINISKPESSKNVEIVKGESPDGRPAEFADGKIKFYPDAFAKDLRALAEGKTILAHGADIQPTVYRLKAGESMNELATRYFKDVLIHELAHSKTITTEDTAKAEDITKRAIEAQKAGDQKAIAKIQTELQAFMKGLEAKANAYGRLNYTELHNELFPDAPARSTAKFDKAVEGKPAPKKITRTETQLLKKQLKDKVSAAKVAFKAGEKAKGTQLAREIKEITTKLAQQKDLAVLKENIVGRSKAQTAVNTLKNVFETVKEKLTRKSTLALLKENIKQRSRFDMTMEAIKDRKQSVASIQNELLEYAKLIPAKIRGKFTRRITKATTESQFIKILDAMKQAADLEQRKYLHIEIKKELSNIGFKMKNGIPTNVKFSLPEQKALTRIKQNINGDYAVAQEKADTMILDYAEKGEPLPDDVFKEIQYLRMEGINEMTAAEMRETLANIQSIKETGKTVRELQKFNRDTEDQQVIDVAKDVIQGSKPSVEPGEAITYMEQPKSIPNAVYQTLIDFFDRKNRDLYGNLDALSRYDKGSKPYQSLLNKKLGTPIKTAYHNEFLGQMDWSTKLNTAVADVYGAEKASHFEKLKDELNTPVKIEGVPFEGMFSRALAIDAYMKMQDPSLDATFEKMGWTDAVKERVTGILTEQDKKLGEALLKLYREYYPSINDQFIKDTGTDFPYNENYSPISRLRDPKLNPSQEAGVELLMKQAQQYATTKNVHLKSRVGSTLPLKFTDPLFGFQQHVVQMEHYKAFSDPVRLFRKTFNDPEVRALIQKYHSEAELKYILQHIDDIARGSIDQTKVNRTFENLKRNATRAILGYNLSPARSQLTGLMNFGLELPPASFAKGITTFWKAPLANSKFLIDNSTLLQERFKSGYSIEVKEALAKKPGTVKTNPFFKKFQSTKDSIQEHSFVFSRYADKVTILVGAHAAYEYKYNALIKEGIPEERAKSEAITFMEDIINRTQEGSRLDTKSQLQRQGTFYDLLNMFQSQTAKFNRVGVDALRNLKAGRGNKATHIRTLILVWFVIPYLFQSITQPQRTAKEKALYALASPLTNALVIGNLITTIVGWADKKPFGYQPSAVASFAQDLQSGMGKFNSGDVASGLAHIADAIGKLTGVPTKPITRPIENKK